MDINIRWTHNDLEMVASNPRNQGIILSQKTGIGTTPMEMLLISLIGCSGMDVVSILQKKRVIINDFNVFIGQVERAEEYPKVYTKIHIIYKINGEIPEVAAKRAVELSQEKYCSVTAMLRKTAVITHTIILNGMEI
jgi:putative redox protein